MENRQLKFRAWNGKTFWYDFTLDSKGIEINETGDRYLIGNEVQVEQFTGLLDKNGKEIYDGDIMKDETGNTKYKVSHGEYGWCIQYKDVKMPIINNLLSLLEVASNIHQHPELISPAIQKATV